jgi:hypothetical protein
LDLTSSLPRFQAHRLPAEGREIIPAPTAAERVLAAELEARGEASEALSMMVSSIARMVQAGRCSDSPWKAS